MSSSTNSSAPSSNQINPAPFVINDTDQAGLIIVVSSFFLTSSIIFFLGRLFVRLRTNPPWRWDDYCVALTTVLAATRAGITYAGVQNGSGKDATLLIPSNLTFMGKNYLSETIVYIITLYFSKMSIMLLLQRLSFDGKYSYFLYGILVVSTIWALSSILVFTVNCSAGNIITDYPAQCPNLPARWISITVIDILTELALFICPVLLVYGIRMKFHLKFIVITAFSIRLPTILLSILHLFYLLPTLTPPNPNPTLTFTLPLTYRTAIVNYSLLACTFPLLGAFLKPFEKSLGPSRSEEPYPYPTSYPYPSSTNKNSYNSSKSHTRTRRRILGVGSRGYANGSRLGSNSGLGGEFELGTLGVKGQALGMVVSGGNGGDDVSVISHGSGDSRKGIVMSVKWRVEREGSVCNRSHKGSGSAVGVAVSGQELGSGVDDGKR